MLPERSQLPSGVVKMQRAACLGGIRSDLCLSRYVLCLCVNGMVKRPKKDTSRSRMWFQRTPWGRAGLLGRMSRMAAVRSVCL